MKLSNQAWQDSLRVYNAIISHPFNQELMHGNLARDRFAYYIEQDILYLQDFSRCHAIIASKVSLGYIHNFLKYAEYTLIAEQELVHQFFKKIFKFTETGLLTSSTIGYTSYMIKTCLNESVEIAVASLLPCFWIYREVGLFVAKHAKQDNPYYRWIETYTSESFSSAVDELIIIFDKLANNTTKDIRKKMLDTFYKSTVWEWHFWNDSYNKQVFNNF